LENGKPIQMNTSLKKIKERKYQEVINDIFICSKNELAPFATVFSFPPENFEQQKLGSLFGIIKIDDHSEDSSYISNLLVSVLKKEYFAKPHRGAEESFEASLRKANLALAELVRHGVTNWTGKINFAVGAIERNNLHFSCLGNTSIFLIRGGEIAKISEELEKEKRVTPHPLKTFSSISSGKLEIGDKLIFTTHDLMDIFSQEELRQNASHFSREEFPRFLEVSLQTNSELAGTVVVDIIDSSKIKPPLSLARAIEKKKEQKPAPLSPETKKQIKKLDSFSEKKEEVIPQEELLTSAPPKTSWKSLLFKLGEKMKSSRLTRQPAEKSPEASGRFFEKAEFPEAEKEAFPFPDDRLQSNIRRSLLTRWTTVLQAGARDALQRGMKKISFSLLSLFRKIEAGHFAAKISSGIKRLFSKAKILFSLLLFQLKKIGWKNKTLLKKIAAGIAILGILSFVFVFFIKNRNEKQKTSEEIASQTTEPVSTPQNLDDINVKNIEEIEEVVSLGQPAISISFLENYLYVVPEKSSWVWKIDPASKSIEETKSNLAIGDFKLAASMPHLKSLFFLTEDNKVVSFTPVNKNFQENSISLPSNLKAADMKTYLTYLYFLDPEANQVYRYPRAEGGFGEKQNWIRNGQDIIKNTKSFAINDDLFAASSSEITAFLQGKMDSAINFEKTRVPLAIDKIFSEADMEGIYALDNKNHRIVEYGKNGKILSQYWNAQIFGIKDFSVDEKSKEIYLLQENKIKKFVIE